MIYLGACAYLLWAGKFLCMSTLWLPYLAHDMYGWERSWSTQLLATTTGLGANCLCCYWLALCSLTSLTSCSTYCGAKEIRIDQKKGRSVFLLVAVQSDGMYSINCAIYMASGQILLTASSGSRGTLRFFTSLFEKYRFWLLRIIYRNYRLQALSLGKCICYVKSDIIDYWMGFITYEILIEVPV